MLLASLAFILLYIILDSIWLIGGKQWHEQVVQQVTNNKEQLSVDYIPALAFYVVSLFAYLIFIKDKAKNRTDAFYYGAALGFIMYATYDLTSKAIYKDAYPWTYAGADIMWGTLVFGTVCAIMQPYLT